MIRPDTANTTLGYLTPMMQLGCEEIVLYDYLCLYLGGLDLT